MSLESVFYITQIISALAIVGSLFYVSIEVRQNTKATRVSSYQAAVQSSIHLLETLYKSKEAAELYHRGLYKNNELSEVDRIRFHSLLLAVYRHWDNLLYQSRMDSLEDEMWQSYDRTMMGYIKHKVWRDWFDENKYMFSPSLQDHILKKASILQTEP